MNSTLEIRERQLADRVGEVIESDSTAFEAQCYRLHEPPALGSLVLVPDGDVEVVGVVSVAGTSSIQPGRKPLARGENEPSVEALYANNPQIEKLLMTLFTAQIVGYRNGGETGESMMQRLPSRPPRVHTFVYDCPIEDVAAFGESMEFLSILVGARGPAGDQLISACLRRMSAASEDKRAFLIRAGKALAVLLAAEPQRLYTLLAGIRP